MGWKNGFEWSTHKGRGSLIARNSRLALRQPNGQWKIRADQNILLELLSIKHFVYFQYLRLQPTYKDCKGDMPTNIRFFVEYREYWGENGE